LVIKNVFAVLFLQIQRFFMKIHETIVSFFNPDQLCK